MALNYIDNDYTISYYNSITGSRGVSYTTIISGSGTVSEFSSSVNLTGGSDNLSSFSYSCQISGSKIIVGAPGSSGNDGKVYVFNKSGQDWNLETSLSASELSPATAEYFGGFDSTYFGYLQGGSAISLRTNKILVGAPREEVDRSNNPSHYKGAAYLFTSGGSGYTRSRIYHEAVTGSSQATGYGHSVVLGDSFFAISAPNEYSTPGASSGAKLGVVFVYNYDYSNGDDYVQILTASSSGNTFGGSLAVDEVNNLLITRHKSTNHNVEVFKSSSANGWAFEQVLAVDNNNSSSDFGHSIDACEGYLIVGARYDEPEGDSLRGAAFVYKYNGSSYNLEQTFSGSAAGELFGRSVTISKSGSILYAAIGSQEDNASGEDGAVSVFKSSSSGWALQAKLTSSSGDNSAYDDDYAKSCDIYKNTLIVGSPGEETYGRAYVYQASSSVAPDTSITKGTNPPFRFISKTAGNLRLQSQENAYRTFLGID